MARVAINRRAVRHPILIRPRSSIAGHGDICQVRVVLLEFSFVESKVRHDSRRVVFDYYVNLWKHSHKKIAACGFV